MNKTVRIIILLLIAAFAIMQLFQPEKNKAAVTNDDIVFKMDIPQLVKKTIITSCYDCHSNQTRYPWYASLSPISWMISKHVEDGKEALNFSAWGQYSKREQISLLDDIFNAVSSKGMPLQSYLIFHKDAGLFDHEIKDVCNWTEEAAENLMN